MIVLGIETSCDETSVAVLDGEGRVLANVVSSQMQAHARYGGRRAGSRRARAPREPARRARGGARHGPASLSRTSASSPPRPGPGLIGALLVGLSAGKALAFARGIPLVGVNHLEGHLFSAYLRGDGDAAAAGRRTRSTASSCRAATPSSCASRTATIVPLARTRDDAPGEAFDKIARRAGLGYPGGPVVDRIAARGRGGPASLRHRPRPRRLARLLLLGPEDRDAARAREARRRRLAARSRTPSRRSSSTCWPPSSTRSSRPCSTGSKSVHRDEGIRAIALSGGRGRQHGAARGARGLGRAAAGPRACCPSAPSRPTTPR